MEFSSENLPVISGQQNAQNVIAIQDTNSELSGLSCDSIEDTNPVCESEAEVVNRSEKKSKIRKKATRREVGNSENIEFTGPLSSEKSKRNSKTSANSSRKKGKNETLKLSEKASSYCIYLGWSACCLLMVRLLLSEGGVLDYYSKKEVFDNKQFELELIKKDNSGLVSEIGMIQNDSPYQKKLVRDNLGFISKDEYLILFPKERSL